MHGYRLLDIPPLMAKITEPCEFHKENASPGKPLEEGRIFAQCSPWVYQKWGSSHFSVNNDFPY
jgi:hypothetical protein